MREKKVTIFEEIFGGSVRVKILEFFLEADKVAFPIEAIIEDKKIGKSQTYDIIKEFIKRKYLLKDYIYKKKQFYKLNTRNPIMKDLKSLFRKLLLVSF